MRTTTRLVRMTYCCEHRREFPLQANRLLTRCHADSSGGIPGMGEMDDFLGLGGMGSIPKKLLRDRKSKAKSEPKE